MERSRAIRNVLLVLTGLFAVLGLGVALGLLDLVARDGRVARGDAIQSLAAYWLVASLFVVGVRFASRHWRDLLLALLAVLIAAGLVEAALRWARVPLAMRRFAAVGSRGYHHIYPPNSDMFQGVYEGRTVVVHTNEDGLRTGYTHDLFRRYPERVVMLGDSFVFGYGVPQELGITSVMERLLRNRLGDSQVAVLNAGIVSASPLLERRLLAEKLRDYRPTLVVLLLDPTDIGDDMLYQSEARVHGDSMTFAPPPQDKYPYRGALLTLIGRVVVIPRESRPVRALTYPFRLRHARRKKEYDYYDFRVKIGTVLETNRFFIYRHPLEETRPYFQQTLDNINATAREARHMNARFVLAINPRSQHWNPAEAPDNWEKGDYPPGEPYQYEYFRFFEEARSQVEYPIFSLLPAFQATREFPLVFKADPHWNARGNAFAASVLVNHLIESGAIGRDSSQP